MSSMVSQHTARIKDACCEYKSNAAGLHAPRNTTALSAMPWERHCLQKGHAWLSVPAARAEGGCCQVRGLCAPEQDGHAGRAPAGQPLRHRHLPQRARQGAPAGCVPTACVPMYCHDKALHGTGAKGAACGARICLLYVTELPGITMLRHPPRASVPSQVIPCQQARVDIPAVFGPQVCPRAGAYKPPPAVLQRLRAAPDTEPTMLAKHAVCGCRQRGWWRT